MLVIPAIDLKDGQCVRLRQGRMNEATSYGDDPVAMAARWVEAGARRLHLVDLNGAFAGSPVNAEAINAIAAEFPDLPIQIGGGIRSRETIARYLDAGVSWVIIGTRAVQDPDFVTAMCREFPGHIIVGIDARDGHVATDGWEEVSSVRAVDLARRFASDGVSAIVYTDISRDGMMQGVNIEATVEMASHGGVPVIASGGVTSLDDIQQLADVAPSGILGAITGRAIYEGRLDLAEAQMLCDTIDRNAGEVQRP
ncbi:1-(5-phosphoribosyl)-5-[(5-phosphoribosylamino)methylideneamino] imidazole-4-carboxamide isomerase [Kushneria sinocarnis]|uniref:1-(5-phosphoribosyl)-5-[(5-phosphoribosylamino)methylideneamino] imidazole-4-carboxamide isomerase n=1 Tax=Kushneria sinocarnis TaxID=595502 RepID=A0A420WSL7_9GAMM|nr:1-(5-phosphoribosyl)-5-[(5-phosphoribosylamino)methylideneamino]imidazole-4-carboxamide isomerase [Kushneria sinocarnis]RKQ95756.1 1-(5-phosphoribosyl)-5-[(5-phosphoribosylamino)methylideneamino] imidazole-4-carboxamide isomerase [Kushneria sinocarnis]